MPATSSRDVPSSSVVTRLLPFTFAITLGPSVTAATALYIVRVLMCRYGAQRRHESVPADDDPRCSDPYVGALTASVITGLAVLDGVISFLSTSYIRNLSDKYGRRPLLYTLPLLALISTGSIVIAYLFPDPVLPWIFLAINGILVSASTKSLFVPVLSASDVADDQQKTRFFSLLEALSLLGPGIGYILSALASRYSKIVLLPYYLALGFQLVAAIYAFLFIPETVNHNSDAKSIASANGTASVNGEDEEGGIIAETVEDVVEAVVEPVKPLALLLPHRDKETGKFEWRLTLVTFSLLATTIGTVFIPTASLLYLSDKFGFQQQENGWILAYLALSKFVFVLLIFPIIQKAGRKLYHAYHERKIKKRGRDTERSRLIQRESFRRREANSEANHFDVRQPHACNSTQSQIHSSSSPGHGHDHEHDHEHARARDRTGSIVSIVSENGSTAEADRQGLDLQIILLFLSVALDAVALFLVSMAKTPKQAIISYAFLALGSGDNPTYKSVFTSLVPEDEGSEALAALDMVWNAARLLSPLLLGTVYAVLLEKGVPEQLFLVAGASCAVGGALVIPLVVVGKRETR